MSKRKKLIIIIVCVVLALFLVMGLAGALLINSYLSKVQYDTGKELVDIEGLQESILTDEEILGELLADDPASGEADSSQEEIDALESQMAELLKGELEHEADIWKDIVNVLVVGCDSRKKGGVGRSDVMILCSVNEATEKIHMTSIMRDCYVSIPGKNNNRINAAYAFGGGSLLLDTVETNFDVDVEKYVAIDFYSFVDIVDSIGGIEINVKEEEISLLNESVHEMNVLNGRPKETYYVTESGPQNLNGTQALGYARIRHIGNGDFDRTSRQRTVIAKIFEKAKTLNLLELDDLLNTVLPMVKTNMTQGEILSLMVKSVEYLQYDLESHRLPVDGSYQHMRVKGMAVLGIDFEENRNALKDFVLEEAE